MKKTAVLAGLDGRKMSKSYNNTIPLFVDEKKLRKLIMKIKNQLPGAGRAQKSGGVHPFSNLPGLCHPRGNPRC